MVFKPKLGKFIKIITQLCHYEAKIQHLKHTHKDKMKVRGSRKLSMQTNIKKLKIKKTQQHKISQNPTQNPIVVFEATTSK
jgi:hypothetical protein